MKAYKDLNGNSGITAYEIGENTFDGEYIKIEFVSGGVYIYTKERLGLVNFEIMKALAEAGAGLCGFISKIRKLNSLPNGKPTKAEVDAALFHAHDLLTAYRS